MTHLSERELELPDAVIAKLLKIASEDECRIADRDPKLSAHGCVELLQLEKIEGCTFIFELTNKKAVYPLIV